MLRVAMTATDVCLHSTNVLVQVDRASVLYYDAVLREVIDDNVVRNGLIVWFNSIEV
jgi:hypothetical protein